MNNNDINLNLDHIKQCYFCNKIFQTLSDKRICPDCVEEIDETFVKVRDYLYDNPNAKLNEVCERLEVNDKIVLHLVREGRLELKDAVGPKKMENICIVCGKKIEEGRICDNCHDKLQKDINPAANNKNDNNEDDGSMERMILKR